MKNLLAKARRRVGFRDFNQNSRRLSGQTATTLIKQTIVVVCVSIVLCVLISVMDSFILEGINLLMK